MGLGEHLDELRGCLLRAIFGLVPLVAVALYFGDRLLPVMLRPALEALKERGLDARMQATSAMETFGAYIYVSFLAALVVGGPWVVYQAWRFVAPGLYAGERRFAYVLAPLSVVLSAAGAAMMYGVMLPVILGFLLDFGKGLGAAPVATAPVPAGVVLPMLPVLEADPPEPQPGQMWINRALNEIRVCLGVAGGPGGAGGGGGQAAAGGAVALDIRGTPLAGHSLIQHQLKVSEFVDLFLQLTLAFVLAFQLPVVVLLLGWAGLATPAGLGRYRRYALLGSVVLGAVILPTNDPLSLFVLSGPLYALYELSIVLLRVLPAARLMGEAAGDRGGPADGP